MSYSTSFNREMSPTIKLEDGTLQRELSSDVKVHRLASPATLEAAKDVPSPSTTIDDNKKVLAPKLSPEQVYRLLPDAWLTAKKLRYVNENEVAKKVCFGMVRLGRALHFILANQKVDY